MSGFLYFLPSAPALSPAPELLAALGLEGVFRGVEGELASLPATAGPAGQGLLWGLAEAHRERGVRFDAAAQDWEQEASGRFWLGAWRDARPGPDELARPVPQRVAGELVRMADDREWLVPVARRWGVGAELPEWGCSLEHSVRRRPGGGLAFGQVAPRMAGLWQEACELAELAFDASRSAGGGARVYELPDWYERLARLLAVNYRVSAAEVDFLGLASEAAAGAAFDVLVDVPGFNAVAELLSKKNCGGTAP